MVIPRLVDRESCIKYLIQSFSKMTRLQTRNMLSAGLALRWPLEFLLSKWKTALSVRIPGVYCSLADSYRNRGRDSITSQLEKPIRRWECAIMRLSLIPTDFCHEAGVTAGENSSFWVLLRVHGLLSEPSNLFETLRNIIERSPKYLRKIS